jgi:hypothetical protein
MQDLSVLRYDRLACDIGYTRPDSRPLRPVCRLFLMARDHAEPLFEKGALNRSALQTFLILTKLCARIHQSTEK